jgi:TP901 family phage tail tape measure protein
MAVVNDLVTKFSFQGSISPLFNFNKNLGKGIGILAGLTTALVASSAAVTKWAGNVLEGVDAMEQLSRTTGVSVEYLQEMRYVAEQTGSSFGAVESTITNLSQKIGDAALKGSEDFARLGISVRDSNGKVKDADQVLSEVHGRFKQLNLSMSEQKSLAGALGIDNSLLQMMGKTTSEIKTMRDRAKELGTLTSEQADQATNYTNSVKALRFGLDGLKRLISVGLAPQMSEMVEGFTELIAKNKDWIINGIQATMEFISQFMKALKRLAPVIAAIGAVFVVAKIATLGFSGALGLLFSPAILIAAGIAAILLVVDDLIVAFRGGNSVIANFFQEFFNFDIVPVLENIVDTAVWMFGLLKSLFSDFLKIIQNTLGFIVNIFTGKFQEAWDNIKEIFSATKTAAFLKEPFMAFFNWLDSMWDNVIGKITGLINKIKSIKDKIPFLGGDDSSDENNIGATISNVTQQRPEMVTALRGVPQNNLQQQVNIEIKTDNPEQAGAAVRDNLNRQMKDAQTQFKKGGR